MKLVYRVGVWVVASLFSASISSAATSVISISDCTGAVRTHESVVAGSRADVSLVVSNGAPEGIAASLLPKSGGEVFQTVQSTSGRVMFRDVPVGDWKVCFESDGGSIESIALLTNDTSSGFDTTTGIVGAGLAGGATVLALSLGGSSSSSQESLSGGGTTSGGDSVGGGGGTASGNGLSPSKPSGSSSGGAGVVGTASRPGAQSADCFISDNVTPVSPFS